jgi:hypothetical protein
MSWLCVLWRLLVRDAEDRATLAEKEARERVVSMEAESATVLASAHEETEGFTQRIALLKGELANARQAQDVAEENSQGLSDAAADAERRREESERECQEFVEELTLLQIWGSELCLAIVGPLKVRSHLPEGMRVIAHCHAEMDEELDMLRASVSSTEEFVLGRSSTEAFQVEVVDELVAEY